MAGYVCSVDITISWDDVAMPDATTAEEAEAQCLKWLRDEHNLTEVDGDISVIAAPAQVAAAR